MEQRDNPGVIALPPLLYGIAFGVALLLRWLWPVPLLSGPASLWAGVSAIVLGMALLAWGVAVLRRAGTNVNPSLPTTALVVAGPYRLSRNPLYLALSLVFLGLSLAVNTLWGVLVLVPLLALMHYGVVLREERYLHAKFGESYRQYCSEVRRYL